MYEVKLYNLETGAEVKGTQYGQGFYPYKKLKTVEEKLTQKITKLDDKYKKGYTYYIYYTEGENQGKLASTIGSITLTQIIEGGM